MLRNVTDASRLQHRTRVAWATAAMLLAACSSVFILASVYRGALQGYLGIDMARFGLLLDMGYLPASIAALAYGAQGLWYFHYLYFFDGRNFYDPPAKTRSAARAATNVLFQAAKETNARVAGWGPKLLGRTADKVCHTGTGSSDEQIGRQAPLAHTVGWCPCM